MTENSSEIKHWPDPKDYGLPFVDVKPLHPVVDEEEVTKVPQEEPIIEPAIVEEAEVVASTEEETVTEEKIVEEEPVVVINSDDSEVKPVITKKVAVDVPVDTVPPVIEKKKSKSWVVIVLILAVLVISVIVWQLMSQGNDRQIIQYEAIVEETPSSQPEAVQPAVENTAPEEIQTTENQDSIPKSNSSLEEPEQTQQTGTTIDRTGAETLIRVESKSDRPQYFIVVGSLPNEQMAISESAQYLDRASSVYLILPYEEVRNYRLAIGTFTSFRKASEELDQVKDQYTEALWILKY